MERPNAYVGSAGGLGGCELVLDGRLGAGPISWGVCEVPGWGQMLPADRVLAEMRSLGIAATELGAPGFLPDEPGPLREVLDRHGVALIGGFVPLVLHDVGRRDEVLASARRTAELYAASGADVFVSAVVVDGAWSAPFPLSARQHDHLVGMLGALDEIAADHGLVHALHPHAGTLVETRRDVDAVLEGCDVGFCLDTGHLFLGGYDPLAFASTAGERVVHVHLKDVRAEVVDAIARGATDFHQAILDGLFCPLGQGDAPIVETVQTLEGLGYDGWYVLEQDTDLGDAVPPSGAGPVIDVGASAKFLRSVVVASPAG